MNNHDPYQAHAKLQQLGLLAPTANDSTTGKTGTTKIDTTNTDNQPDNTPWFIHLFFGFSGVVSSVFLVGFLTLLLTQIGIFEHAGLQLIIGIALSVVAFAAFTHKKTRQNTFWNSLAFAISGAGQMYLLFALFSSALTDLSKIWLFVLLQIIMTLIMPNFVYRLLSSMATLGGLVYLLNFYQLPELSMGLLAFITIMANVQRYPLLSRLYAQRKITKGQIAAFDISKALSYASAIILLGISVYLISAEYGRSFINDGQAFSYNYTLAQGLLILASLYATYLILKRYHITPLAKPSLIVMSIVIILGILSVYVSGLLATSLVIAIAFANSQRVLLGLGVVALVSYIFWYYYQLDTSLLIKSGSMLIIGLVVLLLRELLKRFNIPKAALL
ncbi:DUF4401 domain-containing protein [Psychrobacter sp. GP33]|uniref:DUF4401 domain-containing protein n=1 Tax=Psychrobacter sp. GP33 TaxID=2758709 RepID=UPI0015FB99ED|nr:DUF4401 domain-containing protein [Psychrobacter sp. GP33]